MAQIYNIISIVGFSLAGVFLIISIFSWFKFGILGIIGDLSGRTAKKSIAQMRADNEKSGNRKISPGYHTAKKEKHSGKTSNTKKAAINCQKQSGLEQPITNEEKGEATTMLNYGEGATEMLNVGTEVLNYDPAEAYKQQQSMRFEMIQSVVLIHTQEKI